MIRLLREIKKNRVEQGLTQMDLASKANVCLATLQNLEAARGNPELKTVISIFSALGLTLKLSTKRLNYEKWTGYGVPLLGKSSHFLATRQNFITDFSELDLSKFDNQFDDRTRRAWVSFLCAVRDHYPDIFNTNMKLKGWISKYQDIFLSPKLRRISLENIGKYL